MEQTSATAFGARIYELAGENRCGEALALCRERLVANPADAVALGSAGVLYVVGDDFSSAIDVLKSAIRLSPETAAWWSNLGAAYFFRQDFRRAARILAHARRLGVSPSRLYAAACRGRASDLRLKGLWARAARYLREALCEEPDDAVTWSDLGAFYGSIGKIRAGARCLRRAILLDPANPFLRSNLAVISNYDPALSCEQVRDLHYELFQRQGNLPNHPANDPVPDRKLRVGYYSADFRFRPPAFFLPPLLRHHDRNQFVIFCYSNTQYEDEYTTTMRSLSDHWRDARDLDDGQLAELIRADAIDILVDRTGHFERGRPGLFSRGPAPVQVSLPGYPSTTGVPEIGYRITDSYADPPGMTEHLHSESLVRLPHCFACYSPAGQSPEITSLPAATNGYVTFGCFQKRDKISAPVLGLWARILVAVPNSRLTFHHLFSGVREVPSEFSGPITRFFRKRSIDPDRISWEGRLPHFQHMEAIGRVDMALDTYPYNGMTTTCECLWMGIPVVTRRGMAHISRVGLSYLSNVGLGDWAAESDEQYLAIAVQQASDLSALARTREHLREAMLASPLTDGPGYTRAMETAFRSIWKEWCIARPKAP